MNFCLIVIAIVIVNLLIVIETTISCTIRPTWQFWQ